MHSEFVSLKKVNDSTYHTHLIKSYGKIGLGLKMFDRQDLSYSRNGIYKARVEINGKTIVRYEFDQLDYSDSKKLLVNLDYPTFIKKRSKILKLFFQNHKPLTFMKYLNNEGLFNIELGKSYLVKVIIEDFSGNSSYIEIYIDGTKRKFQIKSLRVN